MERGRGKSVLIPISPLKTLLNTNRDALARLCADYGKVTGHELETLPEVTKMRFTGERKQDNVKASLAVSYLESLMEIIRYMVQTAQRIESDEVRSLMTTDFETFVRSLMDILIWFDTGEEYNLPDDVLRLIIETKIAKLRRDKNDFTREALDHLSKDLLKDDPAQRYNQTRKSIPYVIHKYILEKKIPITESVKTICQEFGETWKQFESRMDQLRNKNISDDATWNAIFTEKENLIERWKTTLTAVGSRK